MLWTPSACLAVFRGNICYLSSLLYVLCKALWSLIIIIIYQKVRFNVMSKSYPFLTELFYKLSKSREDQMFSAVLFLLRNCLSWQIRRCCALSHTNSLYLDERE